MFDIGYGLWQFLIKYFLTVLGWVPGWMYDNVNIIMEGFDLAKRGGGRG